MCILSLQECGGSLRACLEPAAQEGAPTDRLAGQDCESLHVSLASETNCLYKHTIVLCKKKVKKLGLVTNKASLMSGLLVMYSN